MKKLLKRLKEKQLTIASVESITGGLFANRLTNISGASEVFRGSIVSYQLCTKETLLGIAPELLLRHGAISSEVAKEMAERGQALFKSDIAVAITGNAGPKPSEDKPVGLIYLAITYLGKTTVQELHLTGTRVAIKSQCVDLALQSVLRLLA